MNQDWPKPNCGFSFSYRNCTQRGNHSCSFKWVPQNWTEWGFGAHIFVWPAPSVEAVPFWPVTRGGVTTHRVSAYRMRPCVPQPRAALRVGRVGRQGKVQTSVPKSLTPITSLPGTYHSREVNQPSTTRLPAQWKRRIAGSLCLLGMDHCHVRTPLRVALTESGNGNCSSGQRYKPHTWRLTLWKGRSSLRYRWLWTGLQG